MGDSLDEICPETVRDRWDKIGDMSHPVTYESIQESTGHLIEKLTPLSAEMTKRDQISLSPVRHNYCKMKAVTIWIRCFYQPQAGQHVLLVQGQGGGEDI